MKKFFSLILCIFPLISQALTLTTTNVYSIRYFIGGEYDKIMCICDFGEVINTTRGWDIGAYQTQKNSMENRTIMTFDIRSVPLTQAGNPIANVTLNVPLQNQQNGVNSAVIDIFSFYNETQITTNNWNRGTYYTSFPDWPNLQSVNITSLVKSYVSSGVQYLNMRMSTTVTNSHCVFVDPQWGTNETSLVITYSPTISSPKNLKIP